MAPLRLPSIDEIRAAAERIRHVILRTPLVPLRMPGDGPEVLLKPEIHQAVGSFKLRGVFHAVASLDPEARARGVATVSAGNTAQALAWAARHFGVPARSLMPETAPRAKIEAVQAYGGTPVLVPVEELFRYLRERGWEREPYAFIHPWTDPAVMTGHGSIGLEILEDELEDEPAVDSVLVPVGGGGLIAGVGAAVRALAPSIRIVAVEPKGCAALAASLEKGAPASVDCRTMCDGVAVPYITEEMFPLLQSVVDEVVLVPDAEVERAIRHLALENKIVAEGAGALATAAAIAMPPERRGRAVSLVTGGSLDPEKLARILTRPD